MSKTNIFIISGPTGCGESTITNEIIKRFPNFTRLVTATSRSPRLNEKNGVDYFFFSKEDFENEIKKGNIIENTYIANRGTYYGSYKIDLENKLANGFNIIVNPDIVGAKFYKENYGAVTIFIKPDSLENLKKRLMKREPNISQDELQKRLTNAESEIKEEESFYEYTVINEEGKLEEAVKEVAEIIKKHNA
jgi:guanylate kinase